jgi:hypothetical protein
MFADEGLCALYSSPNVIRVIEPRKIRLAGHVAPRGKRRDAYRVLVERSEGRRNLGKSMRRWDDNI